MTCLMWYDDPMTTDERPLSQIRSPGPTGVTHYHALSEAELSDAIQRCTGAEIRMLSLAAKGYSNQAICKQLGIKGSTLTRSKQKETFRDSFYTIQSYGFSSETVIAAARSKALDLIEKLNDIAMLPITEDTKPAQLTASVSSARELLTISKIYKNTVQDPTQINIGQLLIQLSQTDSDTRPTWKR